MANKKFLYDFVAILGENWHFFYKRISNLLYGWVCFRHAIGQFAVRNLLYGPKFLKKMLISEL